MRNKRNHISLLSDLNIPENLTAGVCMDNLYCDTEYK